jgi:hypothetical protein
MKAFVTALILLTLDLGHVSNADAQIVPRMVPTMTMKIFNDDPAHYIFPVLTTGQGMVDIWLQAIFQIPQDQNGNFPYPRDKSFRIYINPSKGIGPGQSVTITVPLYTQLVTSVAPKQPNQYIDWWNGGTIQLFGSDTATPPRALTDDLTNRPGQQPVKEIAPGAILPTCTGNCQASQPLQFFSDTGGDLPKNDPSQLIEYTLGARVQLMVNNPNKDPTNALDLQNVDFDVSYVNVAYAPAAMGPYQNDQVGYVGTPQLIDTFTAALDKFLTDFPGWPQFVRTYPTAPTPETILKLPSPLEIFSRLATDALAPPDLTPLVPPEQWPNKLWTPVQALRDNWIKYAGSANSKVNSPGTCRSTGNKNGFCDAVLDVKTLMFANFQNYLAIFAKQCSGTPITLTDDKMISHVYGWAPFTEAASGTGCGAGVNLLENTPGYSKNNYAKYLPVKEEFDKLNYGLYAGAPYVFNPWVVLIHGQKYVDAPNVYAYSVDDAVGNIQAEATGFIIDVASTKHLENQLPAAPPININIGFGGPQPVQFTSYRICKNDAAHDKPVNPHFPSFVINANNPAKCPIYFLDNKPRQQLYTFTITKAPPFTLFQNPADAEWNAQTASWINCTGNTGTPPFQQSSKAWCCDKTARNGVWAYSTPEPHNVHQSEIHNVITNIPQQTTSNPDMTCSEGK